MESAETPADLQESDWSRELTSLCVLGYFDAPGASEAALMVATGQKDTFGNVVMVFCNIDGCVHSALTAAMSSSASALA